MPTHWNTHGAAADWTARHTGRCEGCPHAHGAAVPLPLHSHFSGSQGSLGCLASWCICSQAQQQSMGHQAVMMMGHRHRAKRAATAWSAAAAVQLHSNWAPAQPYLHRLQVRRCLCTDVAPATQGRSSGWRLATTQERAHATRGSGMCAIPARCIQHATQRNTHSCTGSATLVQRAAHLNLAWPTAPPLRSARPALPPPAFCGGGGGCRGC